MPKVVRTEQRACADIHAKSTYIKFGLSGDIACSNYTSACKAKLGMLKQV